MVPHDFRRWLLGRPMGAMRRTRQRDARRHNVATAEQGLHGMQQPGTRATSNSSETSQEVEQPPSYGERSLHRARVPQERLLHMLGAQEHCGYADPAGGRHSPSAIHRPSPRPNKPAQDGQSAKPQRQEITRPGPIRSIQRLHMQAGVPGQIGMVHRDM